MFPRGSYLNITEMVAFVYDIHVHAQVFQVKSVDAGRRAKARINEYLVRIVSSGNVKLARIAHYRYDLAAYHKFAIRFAGRRF